MKKFGFYLNAENLLIIKEFNNLKEADWFCRNEFKDKYWNILIKKIN